MFKFIIQAGIIHALYNLALPLRRRRNQVFFIDHLLKHLLNPAVFGQTALHRSGDIRQICLARIVQQTRQNLPAAAPFGLRHCSTVQAMLRNRIKYRKMPVGTCH